MSVLIFVCHCELWFVVSLLLFVSLSGNCGHVFEAVHLFVFVSLSVATAPDIGGPCVCAQGGMSAYKENS